MTRPGPSAPGPVDAARPGKVRRRSVAVAAGRLRASALGECPVRVPSRAGRATLHAMTFVRQHTALAQAYDGITRVVADLDDDALQRPTRCRGWVVADLLFHLLCDAQRALVTLASPADGPADTDDVSYWRSFPAGADPDAAARHAGGPAARPPPSTGPPAWCGSGPTPPRPPYARRVPPTRRAASPPRGTCCGCPTSWPR